MSEEHNEQSQLNNVTNKAGRKIGKAIGKAAKKAGKLLLKGLKSIFIALAPYVIVALVIFVIIAVGWYVIVENQGKTQDIQQEDYLEYNGTTINPENGEIEVTELSTGNKMVKAFYTYYAEKSLYVTVTDKNGKVVQKEPLQYNSPEFIKKYGEAENRVLKDKYNREKMFYLNPNALFVLDEHLNKNKFRYPEQFIKPVYHDPDTFELKQLTDEEGNLIAKSSQYVYKDSEMKVQKADENDGGKIKQVYIDNSTGEDTFESTSYGIANAIKTETVNSLMKDETLEKVPGVWDYGFGSILNYREFEEERKAIGTYQTMNVWDIENETMLYNVSLDEAEEMCVNQPDKYEGFNKSYKKDQKFEDTASDSPLLASTTSYMIDRVTSPAGFITNQIVCEWQDTGKLYSKTVSFEKDVTVWRDAERQVTENGLKVYIDKNGYDTYASFSQDEEGNITYHAPKMETYKKKEKIKQTFYVEGKGTIHEKIPRYEGEPDTSQVTGSKYTIDYMTNYKTYVPYNVMSDFGIINFTNRTGVDQENLLKLLERQSFTGKTVSDVDLSEFEIGSGASNQNFLNAMQYFEYFELWGETYGVDPMLLVAIASQESGGNHEAHLNSEHGYGIMQIESPGSVITGVTAYNFVTGSEETVQVPNKAAVTDVKDNIKVGAMILANRIKAADYNILYALQSYNFGTGAMDLILDRYSTDVGKSKEEIKADLNDIGWMNYIMDFHRNPNSYLPTPWYENAGVICNIPECEEHGENHYGDPAYIQHVLRYYIGEEDGSYPWAMKEDGTKVSMDGSEFKMGTGVLGSKKDGWLKKAWKKLFGYKNDLFPKMAPELAPQTNKYEYKLPRNQAETAYKLMFALEEEKKLSDYDNFTEDDWKAKFYLWFSNPVGTKWKGKGGPVDSKGMFPEGITKPLGFSPLTIKDTFKLPDNRGITIVSPKNTDVLAISDGRVTNINDNDTKDKGKFIEITHSSGTKTIYGGLNSIKVKNGDVVKMGDVIGKTGDSYKNKDVLYLELKYQNKTIDPTWIISGTFNAADYNMSEEDGKAIKKIIELAYTKIGLPYTNAAGLRSGPNSFDCSGFTWWLYYTVTGKDIGSWTGAQDQVLNNYRVSASELQPGDILMNNDLRHVVLYIGKEDGVDTVIHAANENLGVIKSKYPDLTQRYPKIYRPIALP